jgi:hypothetical protein
MSETEYERRSARTKEDLAAELVPLSFYADAYLDVMHARGVAS